MLLVGAVGCGKGWSYGVSGINFIMLVIMIMIILFILMSIGPLFAIGAVL
jgi:hypothetical protein